MNCHCLAKIRLLSNTNPSETNELFELSHFVVDSLEANTSHPLGPAPVYLWFPAARWQICAFPARQVSSRPGCKPCDPEVISAVTLGSIHHAHAIVGRPHIRAAPPWTMSVRPKVCGMDKVVFLRVLHGCLDQACLAGIVSFGILPAHQIP